jgi:hypothetical protein
MPNSSDNPGKQKFHVILIQGVSFKLVQRYADYLEKLGAASFHDPVGPPRSVDEYPRLETTVLKLCPEQY